MGEIADDIINGYWCEWCLTEVDGEEPGYPRLCADCTKEAKEEGLDHPSLHKGV